LVEPVCMYRCFDIRVDCSLAVGSTRPVRFGISLPCGMENKENARPAYIIREDTDSDSGDGPVLYRDDDDEESMYGMDSCNTNSMYS
jgi:hypothetical protein